MEANSLEAFCPAKDYRTSINFYTDLGSMVIPLSDALSRVNLGGQSFLLQDFYLKEYAECFVLLLSVDNIGDVWADLMSSKVAENYDGVNIHPPKEEPWGQVIYMIGPSGELWQITEFSK